MLLEHTLNVKRTGICPPGHYYVGNTLLWNTSPLPLESRQIIAYLPGSCLNSRSALAGKRYFDARVLGRLALRPRALGDPARTTPTTPKQRGTEHLRMKSDEIKRLARRLPSRSRERFARHLNLPTSPHSSTSFPPSHSCPRSWCRLWAWNSAGSNPPLPSSFPGKHYSPPSPSSCWPPRTELRPGSPCP